MSRKKPKKKNGFTTIKVRDHLRRWIKTEAARQDIPMYQLVEEAFAKGGYRPETSAEA